MSHPLRLLGIVLVAGSLAGYAHAAPSSYVGSSQDFSLAKPTEIPGGTLKPGDYSIHILDQLSDRMIVRVDKADGKQHIMFLGIPHAAFADGSGSGPAEWKTGAEGGQALRGFEFSNGSTVEFVYPKAEAAALATKNATKVIAVDPESEGRPKLTKMSPDDLKVVTLWMLDLTTASPNSKIPALLAKRYTGTEAGDAAMAQNSSAPARPATSASNSSQKRQEMASLESPSTGSGARRHVVSQLPHTGSTLPLIFLTGLLSLLAAAVVRIGRTAVGHDK